MARQLSFLSFIGMWIIMMVAMMLPAFASIASRYINMIESRQWLSIVGVAAGYLGVWSLVGCGAYVVEQCINAFMSQMPDAAIPLAVSLFAIGGAYQFTAFKDRCLTRCRTPFAQLLEYASWKGTWRYWRVGVHQGAYCAGCCWSLMLLLFAFGTMNIGMMVLVALVSAAEKVWARGRSFSHVVGALCLALAVAVIWLPQLAPGLTMPMGIGMP
jgi:predicted metal-binding membrane protein